MFLKNHRLGAGGCSYTEPCKPEATIRLRHSSPPPDKQPVQINTLQPAWARRSPPQTASQGSSAQLPDPRFSVHTYGPGKVVSENFQGLRFAKFTRRPRLGTRVGPAPGQQLTWNGQQPGQGPDPSRKAKSLVVDPGSPQLGPKVPNPVPSPLEPTEQ